MAVWEITRSHGSIGLLWAINGGRLVDFIATGLSLSWLNPV
jgi:hypothetical protein